MVDIATLIARDEGWLTDEEVRRLGVTPLSELESVKKDSGVKCVQCGRPFGEEDRRASMSASVMGDEYTESYFLCPDCNVGSVGDVVEKGKRRHHPASFLTQEQLPLGGGVGG